MTHMPLRLSLSLSASDSDLRRRDLVVGPRGGRREDPEAPALVADHALPSSPLALLPPASISVRIKSKFLLDYLSQVAEVIQPTPTCLELKGFVVVFCRIQLKRFRVKAMSKARNVLVATGLLAFAGAGLSFPFYFVKSKNRPIIDSSKPLPPQATFRGPYTCYPPLFSASDSDLRGDPAGDKAPPLRPSPRRPCPSPPRAARTAGLPVTRSRGRKDAADLLPLPSISVRIEDLWIWLITRKRWWREQPPEERIGKCEHENLPIETSFDEIQPEKDAHEASTSVEDDSLKNVGGNYGAGSERIQFYDEDDGFSVHQDDNGGVDDSHEKSDLPSESAASKSSDSGTPCKCWLKKHMSCLYHQATETNALWSVVVAAALVGLVILGRWHKDKLHLNHLKWRSSSAVRG
ncbi:hypothetical protein GUJ93_ZPchr0004g40329 [Zizania palustris]|uniref:Uncharacterized protein n=1 Tax=Zizania palustris TaxID=103762 RepID=A0A8J5S4Y6_ZIZPA|nr:hypothetical protein GUJ93_ZPchr0004g40329 [Zizania palustris]